MSDEIADIAAAIQKLKSGDSSARQAAIHQLIKIGRPAVDALIPLLKYHHEDVPWRVAYALGIICDARAVEALIEAMNDPSGSVFYYAAGALVGNVPTWSSLPSLLDSGLITESETLPRPVLAETGLTEQQQAIVLESLRLIILSEIDRCGRVPNSPMELKYPLPDIPRFCHRILGGKGFVLRLSAKELLDKIKGSGLFPITGTLVERYYNAALQLQTSKKASDVLRCPHCTGQVPMPSLMCPRCGRPLVRLLMLSFVSLAATAVALFGVRYVFTEASIWVAPVVALISGTVAFVFASRREMARLRAKLGRASSGDV